MNTDYDKSEQKNYKERRSFVPFLFFISLMILFYMSKHDWHYSLVTTMIMSAYYLLSFIFDTTILTDNMIIIRDHLIRKHCINFTDVMQIAIVTNKYIPYWYDNEIKIIIPTKIYVIKTKKLSTIYPILVNLLKNSKEKKALINDKNIQIAKQPNLWRWEGSVDALLEASNKEISVIYEAKWNVETKNNVIRTICALANSYEMGGGFIIIGIEEGENGPIIPPEGLSYSDIYRIEKEIKKASKLIRPAYPYELNFTRINYLGKNILILPIYWSFKNPHYAPENINEENSKYYKYLIEFKKPTELEINVGMGKSNIVQVTDYTLSFYRKGDFWFIGEKGKEKDIKHVKGLSLINMLLRYPNEYIPCSVLEQGGKYITSDYAVPLDKVRDDLQSMTSISGKPSLAILTKPSYQPKYDIDGIKLIEQQIDDLEQELAELDQMIIGDPLIVLERKEEIINKIKLYKKEICSARSHPWSNADTNLRTRVQKSIKNVLEKIHDNKDISYLAFHLNEATIRTGSSCVYLPHSAGHIVWILDPPEDSGS